MRQLVSKMNAAKKQYDVVHVRAVSWGVYGETELRGYAFPIQFGNEGNGTRQMLQTGVPREIETERLL